MTRRERPKSELDLGLDLELPDPEPGHDGALEGGVTDPSQAAFLGTEEWPNTAPDTRALSPSPTPRPTERRDSDVLRDLAAEARPRRDSGVDAETELDLRLPDMTIPPTGLVRPPATALRSHDEPALELARPVGRVRVAGGMRELEPEASADAPPELAREVRRAARPLPQDRRMSGGIKMLIALIVLAGLALGAMLLGLSPARVVAEVRARVPGLAGGGAPGAAAPGGEGGATPGAGVAPDRPAAATVVVPAGTFARGCVSDDPDCGADERPPELVTMPALAVDGAEVSAADYATCVAAGVCTPAGERDPLCAGTRPESARLPINCVDAAQAATFCRAQGKRLPTAVEWEFAARGGQALIFPWGGAPPSCARANRGGCGGKPLPVGGRPDGASGQGARDMAGNVWEWTADGPQERREIRGGSYLDGARTLRASNRGWADARTQIPELGFRCVGAP